MRGILLGSTGTRRGLRCWIYVASAIWSTHVLTATTASSSVMSTNEPAHAAPKSARHAHERQPRTAMCVRSVRAHGHRQHEPQRLPPQQPEVRATSGGLPCGPGHSSKRSTTSRGRSLIDAGGHADRCMHGVSVQSGTAMPASRGCPGWHEGRNSDGPPPVDNLSRDSLVARNVSMYD